MNHHSASFKQAPFEGVGNHSISAPKKGGSLGIVTKTSSPLISCGLQRSKTKEQNTDYRARRFALKSVVNSVLPDSRTSKCMRMRAPDPMGGLSKVELLKGRSTKKAFYQGLMTCGSVWNCPVCAAKVSERRRQELKEAMAQAEALELKTHFVTLTVPHGVSDDINDLLEGLKGCNKRMASGKYSVKSQMKKIAPEVDLEGFIRTLEVTHGKNGFHPHFHLLVFTSANCSSELLHSVYESAWKRACRLSGLPVPNEHGCTVKDGSFASEYVSKWGLEDEMTKANTKVASQKGTTPFGFLQAALDGDNSEYPPERAKALFRVYANAFKGRRQLYWSNGLRAKLCLAKELTDQELAQAPDDERAVLLASLTFEQWKAVLRNRSEAHLLSIAELNPLAIQPYLEGLMKKKGEGAPPAG